MGEKGERERREAEICRIRSFSPVAGRPCHSHFLFLKERKSASLSVRKLQCDLSKQGAYTGSANNIKIF